AHAGLLGPLPALAGASPCADLGRTRHFEPGEAGSLDLGGLCVDRSARSLEGGGVRSQGRLARLHGSSPPHLLDPSATVSTTLSLRPFLFLTGLLLLASAHPPVRDRPNQVAGLRLMKTEQSDDNTASAPAWIPERTMRLTQEDRGVYGDLHLSLAVDRSVNQGLHSRAGRAARCIIGSIIYIASLIAANRPKRFA